MSRFAANASAAFLIVTSLIAIQTRAALVDPIPQKIADSNLSVKLTPIAGGAGTNSPVYLTAPSDNSGRLFVVDQTGVVKVIQNGQAQSTPFLDVRSSITPLMATYDERGLLGMAFDPNFATNGKVYTYYTAPA